MEMGGNPAELLHSAPNALSGSSTIPIGLFAREPRPMSVALPSRIAAIGENMRMQSPDSPQSSSSAAERKLPPDSPKRADPSIAMKSSSMLTTAPRLAASPSAALESAQSSPLFNVLLPSAIVAQATALCIELLEAGALMLPVTDFLSRRRIIVFALLAGKIAHLKDLFH
jgi:hypothetical protein